MPEARLGALADRRSDRHPFNRLALLRVTKINLKVEHAWFARTAEVSSRAVSLSGELKVLRPGTECGRTAV